MNFSVGSLYTMEKEMLDTLQKLLKTAKISSPTKLNHGVLMTQNKDTLANFVLDVMALFENNLELCKSAASKIDDLKSEQIENQRQMLKLQQEQIETVQEKVQETMQDTLKTEMNSWADMVKKNCSPPSNSVTPQAVKRIVRSTVLEEGRTRNLIIYGLSEPEHGDEDLEDSVMSVFEKILYQPYPEQIETSRLGAKETDKVRPLKVKLASREVVERVLRNAHKLKAADNDEYKQVYLAPDRTREERAEHNKLVTEMKRLINEDSSKHYFIRNNKVLSRDKQLSTG